MEGDPQLSGFPAHAILYESSRYCMLQQHRRCGCKLCLTHRRLDPRRCCTFSVFSAATMASGQRLLPIFASAGRLKFIIMSLPCASSYRHCIHMRLIRRRLSTSDVLHMALCVTLSDSLA